MKRILLFSSIIFMSLVLFSQRIKEETTVTNIEVPVRVFSGKTFIDNLTTDDFEMFEVTSPDEVAKQLIGIVKRDPLTGNAEYRYMIAENAGLAQSLTLYMGQTRTTIEAIDDESDDRSFEEQLTLDENHVFKLENLRRVSQDKMMNFAEYLKQKEGVPHFPSGRLFCQLRFIIDL